MDDEGAKVMMEIIKGTKWMVRSKNDDGNHKGNEMEQK